MNIFSPFGLQRGPLIHSPYFKNDNRSSSSPPSGPTDFLFLSGDNFLFLNGQQFELLE